MSTDYRIALTLTTLETFFVDNNCTWESVHRGYVVYGPNGLEIGRGRNLLAAAEQARQALVRSGDVP